MCAPSPALPDGRHKVCGVGQVGWCIPVQEARGACTCVLCGSQLRVLKHRGDGTVVPGAEPTRAGHTDTHTPSCEYQKRQLVSLNRARSWAGVTGHGGNACVSLKLRTGACCEESLRPSRRWRGGGRGGSAARGRTHTGSRTGSTRRQVQRPWRLSSGSPEGTGTHLRPGKDGGKDRKVLQRQGAEATEEVRRCTPTYRSHARPAHAQSQDSRLVPRGRSAGRRIEVRRCTRG
jgi:hypothetical protein